MLMIGVLFALVAVATGHGRLLDPPARGTMWRLGFQTPPDYNDHELFCGGFHRQWTTNGGRCGECGDPWDLPRPRPHEAGGVFGTGTLSRIYRQGQIITAVVHLTANHFGWFEFRLCPTNNPNEYAKQSCLNQNILELADSPGTRFVIEDQSQVLFRVRLKLPRGLKCSHCVLQWHYTSGNNWGFCKDGNDMMGCGKQEIFRGCSDVAIFDQSDSTYYKHLNLTKDFDFTPIINLQDGTYMRKHQSGEEILAVKGQPAPESNSDENQNEILDKESRVENAKDDLSQLDVDGDGVINIDGNLLSLDALKNHLMSSGLLTESPGANSHNEQEDSELQSGFQVSSSTSRSRSKFRADRTKEDKKTNIITTSKKRRNYATLNTDIKTQNLGKPSDSVDIINSAYISSNTFRKSDQSSHSKYTTTEPPVAPVQYATESSNIAEYTLGPVVVHRPARPKAEHSGFNDFPSASSEKSSYMDTSSSHSVLAKPFVPEPEDVLPEILSQLTSLKDFPIQKHTSSNDAANAHFISTTDQTRLLEAVKSMFSASQATTPSPATQLHRIESQDNTVSIPNIIVSPQSNEMVSFGFRRKPTSPDDHTFPAGIFSTITETATKSSRKAKPMPQARQSRPRTATPQTLLDVQATIRTLAAQTQLFSKLNPDDKSREPKPLSSLSTDESIASHTVWKSKPKSSSVRMSKIETSPVRHERPNSLVTRAPLTDLTRHRDLPEPNLSSASRTPFSAIASQALFSQVPDMAGAMAFQVPLSKLRDTATLDRLLELKMSLLPEDERQAHLDPVLLIIM
ncbi:uncharacterized protein LOC108672588 [Hyalella azteca]|uniref:Uncharacterized protein LOC108672588 n=1 Tax=Hyalella azteca TaxID=294128 RepID=A0A8B7NQ08_HYAAZ|nr:uncharacterized protein LOC108672588 [Hyalella azteca]